MLFRSDGIGDGSTTVVGNSGNSGGGILYGRVQSTMMMRIHKNSVT